MTTNPMTYQQGRALAAFLATLRPDWQKPGIEDALGKARGLAPAADLAIAAIKATAATNRTPAVIPLEGPHWRGAETDPHHRFEPGSVCEVCSQREETCRSLWRDPAGVPRGDGRGRRPRPHRGEEAARPAARGPPGRGRPQEADPRGMSTVTLRERALERAAAQSKSGPTFGKDECLIRVRKLYGADAIGDFDGDGSADAEDGWKATKHRHPVPLQLDAIPAGVPLWWGGGSADHGHVAISAGRGMCWSTDITRTGRFDLVPITQITLEWVPPRRRSISYCSSRATAVASTGSMMSFHSFIRDQLQKANCGWAAVVGTVKATGSLPVLMWPRRRRRR